MSEDEAPKGTAAGGLRRAAGAGRAEALRERLRRGPPLLLDGALGTEIERRGAHAGLPLWSTHALLDDPTLVEAIHLDYLRAGSELLVADTFRTQRRTLARAGLGERTAGLTRQAVDLARAAAHHDGSACFVAGSIPPLEDCYRPDLVPDEAALAREHREHAGHLLDAGVDLAFVETMNCAREARAALAACAELDLPAAVSFVCDAEARLLSGEPLAEAIETIAPMAPLAIGVNCLPAAAAQASLPALAASGLPFFVYANLGAPTEEGGFERSDALSPEAFAEHARAWLDAGAAAVGGCCGTTPDHIRAVGKLLPNSGGSRTQIASPPA